MSRPEKFEFERSRGIVWVCDLSGSSKYLNDDKAVDALEQFLPRLHWTASVIVEAARGDFIKWTGDGFLAWFPTPLYRQIGRQASSVFRAAQDLTYFVNVTQLGVEPDREFRIRHGIAYEQDALATKITYPGGYEVLDLTGRGVVLAFRLSGVPAGFPGIATQRELTTASSNYPVTGLKFMRWPLSAEERLKYFKGERWGTSSIYVSGSRAPRRESPQTAIRKAKRAIARAEGSSDNYDQNLEFTERFLEGMLAGPEWCRVAVDEYTRYIREDLLGNLKRLVPIMEKIVKKASSSSIERNTTK